MRFLVADLVEMPTGTVQGKTRLAVLLEGEGEEGLQRLVDFVAACVTAKALTGKPAILDIQVVVVSGEGHGA